MSTTEELTADASLEGAPRAASPRLHRRVQAGMTESSNWFELIKFGAVGASGYAVNLIVYELFRTGLDTHYRTAAIAAFVVAVTNNFLLNRHWTFDAKEGHAGFQAARFFGVSLVA